MKMSAFNNKLERTVLRDFLARTLNTLLKIPNKMSLTSKRPLKKTNIKVLKSKIQMKKLLYQLKKITFHSSTFALTAIMTGSSSSFFAFRRSVSSCT